MMKRQLHWWERHLTGLLIALFVILMLIAIQWMIRQEGIITGHFNGLYALLGGLVTALFLMFVRPLRRFVYPLMPGVLSIGVIGTLLMSFVVPSNWVYLWIYLVVVSGFYMDIMFRPILLPKNEKKQR